MFLAKWFRKADDWLTSRHLPRVRLPKLNLKEDWVSLKVWLKRLMLVFAFALLVFGLGWGIYWLTFTGPLSAFSNPNRQIVAPTKASMDFSSQPATRLRDQLQILDQKEAQNLRQQSGVINLALLDSGSATYATVSVQFDPKLWVKEIPFGLTGLSVSGTGIEFTHNSDEYVLNVYQPFVFGGNDNLVYLVDSTGQIWKANIGDLSLILVDQVKTPLIIGSNSSLSLTFRR